MEKVENIEKQIKDLSPQEMAELREWFAKYDAEAWDRQFESDVALGKLDKFARDALQTHSAGTTTKL